MPELPEVETVARFLRGSLVGQRLCSAVVHFPGVYRAESPGPLFPSLCTDIGRHGKYLLLGLEKGAKVLVHFRMTGGFHFRKPADPLVPHTHVEFPLGNGEILSYSDPRRFGRLVGFDAEGWERLAPLGKLGPDALDLDTAGFIGRVKARSRQMKPLLLDQTVLAGLGNIYVDEALFRAGIHPLGSSAKISKPRLERLWVAVCEVLAEAIEHRGSSIQDFTSPEGYAGSFQSQHRVYGREGEGCRNCGKPIQRIVVAQRSSFFCPACQKR